MSEDSRPANSLAARSAREAAAVRTTPVWSCSITLNTDYAQRVYKRYYDKVRGDLFILTVRTRATGMDEAAGVLEGMLSEEFGALRKDLQDELARTEALMEKVKLDRVPTYEGSQSLQAQYSTPRAKEYLDVIVQMDQLLMNYDALWLTGYIDTQARVNRSQNWQRRLVKTANRLRELGNRTKGGIQREIDRRTQRRQEPADPTQASSAHTPGATLGDASSASSAAIGDDAGLSHVGVEEEATHSVEDPETLEGAEQSLSSASDVEEIVLSSSDDDEMLADESEAHVSAPLESSTQMPADAEASRVSGTPARKSRRGNSAAVALGEQSLPS